MTVTSRTDGVVGHPDRHDADGRGAHGWSREEGSFDRTGSSDDSVPASRSSRDALRSQLYDQGSADPYDQGLADFPPGLAEADEPEPGDLCDAHAAGDGYDAGRAELYETAARGGYGGGRAGVDDGAGRDGDEAVAADGYEAVRAELYEAAARHGQDAARADLYARAPSDGAVAGLRRIPIPDPCDPRAGRMNAASTELRPGGDGTGRARRRMVSKIPVRRSDAAPTLAHDDAESTVAIPPAPGAQIPPVPGAGAAHRREPAALTRPEVATPKGRRVGSSHLPLHLRQRRARLSVFVVLAVTAGLTVLALLTARTPAVPVTSSVPTTPVSVGTSGRVGVGTAGLAPSIEPPPGPAQFGTTLPPAAGAARASTP